MSDPDRDPDPDPDREPPALLSKRQREYLLGEFTPSNETTMRRRIRLRIRYAMRDFSLLYHYHPDDERAFAFEPSDRDDFYAKVRDSEHSVYNPDEVPEATVQDSVIQGMADAMAYFYLAFGDRGLDDDNFAELLRNAVKQAVERREGEDFIATVDISISHGLREERYTELREKFLADEQLSGDELRALLDTDPSIVSEAMADTETDDDEPDDGGEQDG